MSSSLSLAFLTPHQSNGHQQRCIPSCPGPMSSPLSSLFPSILALSLNSFPFPIFLCEFHPNTHIMFVHGFFMFCLIHLHRPPFPLSPVGSIPTLNKLCLSQAFSWYVQSISNILL
ncbi:hypothetical protein PoB_004195900 [Plakobranchus ocellatus]|uniref:Uncharacterized protein n=1 Tax=Plakobranchus ocellatus TaxID=259542 RepID=A0AAV4B5S0_9GAST|nr:hypothetical protein PoB_004195900 [Plakobranchus ocellatus]